MIARARSAISLKPGLASANARPTGCLYTGRMFEVARPAGPLPADPRPAGPLPASPRPAGPLPTGTLLGCPRLIRGEDLDNFLFIRTPVVLLKLVKADNDRIVS